MAPKVNNKNYDELTFQKRSKQRDRWVKVYNGKTYTFPIYDGELVPESYGRCVEAWHRKKQQIDYDNDDAHAWLAMAENLARKMNALAQEKTESNFYQWRLYASLRQSYQRFAARGEPCGLLMEGWTVAKIKADPDAWCFVVTDPEDMPISTAPWETATNAIPAQSPAPLRTVASEAAKFLADKRTEADDGSISFGRLNELTRKVNNLVEYFEKRQGGVNSITSDGLRGYFRELREPLKARSKQATAPDGDESEMKQGKSTARVRNARTIADYKRDAMQFVRWLVAHEVILKPSILDLRTATKVAPKDVVIFSDDDLKVLFANAGEQLRLFMLLSLNCCWTQVDIGTLRQDEIDWKRRRIRRKRHKTSKHESVPTVEYLLWPEAFELLTKYRSSHATLALTADDGGPLWSDSLNKSGIRKIDAIWRPFAKVVEAKIDLNRKSFKNLRKTAATRMESKYPQFTKLLLGHAAKDQSGKHYTQYPQKEFDKAIRWLGEQFKDAIKGS